MKLSLLLLLLAFAIPKSAFSASSPTNTVVSSSCDLNGENIPSASENGFLCAQLGKDVSGYLGITVNGTYSKQVERSFLHGRFREVVADIYHTATFQCIQSSCTGVAKKVTCKRPYRGLPPLPCTVVETPFSL